MIVERYASGRWLDRPLARAAAGTMLAGTVAALAYLAATATGTLDSWGRPLGTDFSNVWTAGRMALAGHPGDVYDLATHYRAQQVAHGSEAVPFYSWHYPPTFLLVGAALAMLPYLAALAVWQVSTLVAALAVIRRCLPDRDTLLVAAGAPAVLVCLTHGNNGFLTAALFGGGLLLLERRPVLAGILLGLLSYKPHLGLVLPLVLMAGGYWRAIASAGVTVVILALASALAFGPDTWVAFWAATGLTRTIVLEAGGPGWHTMVSAFAAIRQLGGGLTAAYVVQGFVTVGALAATAWLWRIKAAFELRAAAAMIAALLVTPYVLDYDMVLLGPAIALLVAYGLREGFSDWEKTGLAIAWFAPIATRQLALHAHLPVGCLVLIAMLAFAVRRGRDASVVRVERPASWIPARP